MPTLRKEDGLLSEKKPVYPFFPDLSQENAKNGKGEKVEQKEYL